MGNASSRGMLTVAGLSRRRRMGRCASSWQHRPASLARGPCATLTDLSAGLTLTILQCFRRHEFLSAYAPWEKTRVHAGFSNYISRYNGDNNIRSYPTNIYTGM